MTETKRKCKECQTNISSKKSDAIFCSTRCNQLNWVNRNKERVKKYHKEYYHNNIDRLTDYSKNYGKLYRKS